MVLDTDKLKEVVVAPSTTPRGAELECGAILSVEDVVILLSKSYTVELLKFCRVLLKNPQDAEEVVLIVLFEASNEFEKTLKVPSRTWIYGRAKSRSIDYLRRRDRRVKASSLEDIVSEPPSSDFSMQPEEAAMYHELQAAYFQALMKLPDEQRTVITLGYLEFTAQEIAVVVGMPQWKVYSLQKKGYKAIRTALEPWR